MTKLKPCPQCGETPTLGYACGEYFIMPRSKPIGDCFCGCFDEMHSNEDYQAKVWNKAVENEKKAVNKMLNKLTDNEIKKALECCANLEACEKCPMASLQKYDSDTCEHQIMLYALDLINRLETENEKNENIIRVADKTIETLNAENESLKAEVERLNNNISAMATTLSTSARATRHEAYKEFADRLKDESEHFELEKENFVSEEQIDNLLNELVGDGDSAYIDKQN